MAKSSRRAKSAPDVEDDDLQEEEGAAPGEMFMTALLIVSFLFILTGILVNSYTLYDRYDAPFLGIIEKKSPQKIQNVVYNGGAIPADDAADDTASDESGDDASSDGEGE